MTKRVLVVEDESAISRIYRRTLVANDFEADIATTEVAAKDMLGEKNYNLCLIDIRTPGMSGMELYHYLKKKQPGLAIKVMFTIGNVLSGNDESFSREANRPCLPKPFTPSNLRAIVREASN